MKSREELWQSVKQLTIENQEMARELMKQEPVAWMHKTNGEYWGHSDKFPDWQIEEMKEYAIPLYTSPQYRELSDDEAIELWDSIPLVPHEGMTGRLKLFAKAILERAKK